MEFKSGDKVLFIGDSITDCDRRGNAKPLGTGYVKLVADLIFARYPELKIEIVNMGVSGDTVKHLAARWDTDVIAQNPDWLFISIGINDVWRQLDSNGVGAVYLPEYEELYRSILRKTRAATKAKICLMETGVIGEDLNSQGNKLLEPYNEVIHKLADEFGLTVVPINQDFRRCLAARPEVKLTHDGVHPTAIGHMVMALSVLGSVGW